ncbi:MAG: hypothetical protein MZW92_14035 [Comamonadaceae bacterium]|nr:hypothetical protein [Comamonadaceae bacterium]
MREDAFRTSAHAAGYRAGCTCGLSSRSPPRRRLSARLDRDGPDRRAIAARLPPPVAALPPPRVRLPHVRHPCAATSPPTSPSTSAPPTR